MLWEGINMHHDEKLPFTSIKFSHRVTKEEYISYCIKNMTNFLVMYYIIECRCESEDCCGWTIYPRITKEMLN
jgi:hypothetical protein